MSSEKLPLWLTQLAENTPFIISSIIFAVLLFGMVAALTYRNQQSKNQDTLKWQNEISQYEQQIALLEQSMLQEKQTQQSLLDDKQQQIILAHERISKQQERMSSQDKLTGELWQKADQLNELKEKLEDKNQENKQLQSELSKLRAEHDAFVASFKQEKLGYEEKLMLLKDAEKQLNTQFENVANKIFEQKAVKFTQTSELGINQLLSPLKTQIDDFKRQIQEQYIKEGQERASLKTEILGLKELNQQITQEASALTNALKGDNKQQGNWGEVVLSRILSESGLREGHEYETEKQLNNIEGKLYRPDVIVHLPNSKDIVIDSKVSLIAHEKAVNATDENLRKQALKEHVNSIKGHIKGLSKKDYQDLAGVKSLDYILMFIPIESAFINAVEEQPELIKLALDNQIMLVSPTNLLVALRTINNIWQYEYQNQHAKTIADKAKRMYDKFAGFVQDMEKIGKSMDTTGKHFEAAMNKLSTGKGNLIAQAESFKTLGVSPNKSISEDYFLNDVTKDDESEV
ncbi:DNA recombination protein RmuC [Glaciecola sp. 2405UD65-10]|uniref:DNA recombination protein RmuC n=1 Tax=Glaciecola sp. 2405UD65-10 TaxID=3397244 RepID=UPI003B5C9226